jgi:Kef-type K+ transport system membrane component KefB
MMLRKDWKDILKKAWSIRLIVLAGLLSGMELILPLFSEDLPRGVFAVMSLLATSGAFVSRLLVQRNMNDDQPA